MKVFRHIFRENLLWYSLKDFDGQINYRTDKKDIYLRHCYTWKWHFNLFFQMELLAQTWWNLHDSTRSCKVKNLWALMPLKGSPSLPLIPHLISETTTPIPIPIPTPTPTPTSPTHAWALLNLSDSKRSCKVKKSTLPPTQCGRITVPSLHQVVDTPSWCNLRHHLLHLYWCFSRICAIAQEKAVTRVLKPEMCCPVEIVWMHGLRKTAGFLGFPWRRGFRQEMRSVKEMGKSITLSVMGVPLEVHFMHFVLPPCRQYVVALGRMVVMFKASSCTSDLFMYPTFPRSHTVNRNIVIWLYTFVLFAGNLQG